MSLNAIGHAEVIVLLKGSVESGKSFSGGEEKKMVGASLGLEKSL